MNKRYNLKLDLQFRCNNSIMKFNEFDNNTSDFFMRITNSGKLVDVEKAIVVLATIKPSGKVSSQFVEVENGLVYADLKPSMTDEIGTYTAKAMLILEDERVITDSISYKVEEDKIFSLLNDTVEDTEDFTLLTDMLNRLSTIEISEEQRMINEAERILSEGNRKIEEAKRVEAELIRQHEEADRAKYDATRESNENIRKQNESIRLANETNRIDEETKRVEEESKRVEAEQLRKDNYNFMTEDEERRRSEANAHKEAEKLRAQAENTRVSEEAKRRTTEQARVSAENTRVSNENTRKANEATRQNNETHRVEAETKRQNRYNSFIANAEANANNFENYTNSAKIKEEERKSNELNRKSQEDRRVSNEVERISNENTRKANEKAREKNETSRQNIFENKVNEVDKKIVELNTTKDNFVSNINTKVDTKISEIDNVKDNFVSSVNTKVDNKISELDNAKSDMTNTVTNKIDEVETRFNALTSSQQQDAEVIDARDGETSLKARLDRDIEKAKEIYMNIEGSNISTDSSVGYAKDIEILGNTIQDASNLADIRSVGDKVEGQELYEIPVLSCGKNLFDHNIFKNEFVENQRIGAHGGPYSSEGFTMLKGLKEIPKFWFNKTLIHNFVGCIAFYSDTYDGSLINRCYQDKTYAVPQNARYFRFEYQNYKKDEFQLEEGTQATPYEPYQEDKLTILSPTQLEKVGDVCDRIIEKDGVWGVEKNVASFTLNGTENWVNGNYDTTNHVSYRVLMPKPLKYTNQYATSFISSFDGEKLAWFYIYNDKKDVQGYGYGDNGFLYFRVPNTKTIKEFKQDLSSNPIIVLGCANEPQFIPLPHDQQVKLRTFAGKTNISFGCEIEGTIKAQVPKSLGATVNTHTEQINNLNKELDRVKKLEESTVSTVTTESDFTTVEATSNGYFEDVKLEGKTLVNKHLTSMRLSRVNTNQSLKGDIVNARVTTASYNHLGYDITNLKPNTKYKCIINLLTNNLAFIDGSNDIVLKFWFMQNGFSEGYKVGEIGVKEFRFTTPNDVTNLTEIKFLGTDYNRLVDEGTYSFRMLLLEENEYCDTYFEGLKSVGQSGTTSEDGADEIVVSSVKGDGNLFDGELEIGTVNSNNGTDQAYLPRCRNKGFIAIKENLNYSIKVPSNYFVNRIFYYGSSYNYISNLLIDSNQRTFTTPSGARYLRFAIGVQGDSNVSQTNLVELRNTLELKCGELTTEYTPHQSDKKRLLYYNTETQTWENPILRQWDSIEKHANGKYYYHVRSIEEDYVEGDEIVTDYITDMTTTVKPLSQEKIYECTNIDLITYNGETNYIVESGAIVPKTTLKVHNNISNVVSLLQKKVSLLESNVKASQEVQDMMILETDMRMLDIELALMEFVPITLNLGGSNMLRSATYFNFLKNHIINETYEKEYLENVMNKYLATGRINQDEYNELYKMLYPPVYDIELPIEY